VFVFHVDAEPLRQDRYPQGHVPFVKARVVVNHHDPDEARRLALVALADEAWLLRMVERIDFVSPDAPPTVVDDKLRPLMDTAERNGVAFSLEVP
jgi:hypothetical protein